MKQLTFGFLLVTALLSCKDGGEESPDTPDDGLKVGEIEHIENLFDGAETQSSLEFGLLKELDICDTVEIEGSPFALCSSKNFKLMPFRNDIELKDAFMLQIKALTVIKGQAEPLPMRHLIVFERENDKLVKVNGFRGNLIATRESASGVKDLVVRFYIPEDEAFLNCLFEWEDKRYRFKSVEAIDGGGGHGSVKAAVKDSISDIVYQSLMSNAMLF